MSPATLLLVQATILITGPWALWKLAGFSRIAPLAVLQILVGVLLGPSVLGAIAPLWQQALFPPESVPRIGAVAQIAVVFFSFVTGLHLDLRAIRGSGRLGPVAAGAFLLPALAGMALAPPLAAAWPGAVGPATGPLGFALALGLLMTVTALPVLAALLKEMGLLASAFGQRAIALAAINDAAMWLCVAAILLLFAGGGEGTDVALLPVYLLLVLAVAWALRRFGREERRASLMVVVCGFAPFSAAFAEHVGLGYVIGAFLAGMAVPQRFRAALVEQLEWPCLFLLMPFFFMATGLRIRTDLLSAETLSLTALVTLVAVVSKVAGAALAARLSGESWRAGAAIGTALQTKGLMEVLVVTILTDRGVIGEVLFAPLVLMALVCTTITAPLLRLLGIRAAPA
jgi:Kef-type K+ transport system membrane component KefB